MTLNNISGATTTAAYTSKVILPGCNSLSSLKQDLKVGYEEKVAEFLSSQKYFEISECVLQTVVLVYCKFVLKRAKRDKR